MRLARTLLLVALAVVATACVGDGARRKVTSPEIFGDIPAPRGAVYRGEQNRSFSYSSSTFRCGRFAFRYDGKQDNVVRFYRDTMTRPPYNWRLVDEDSAASGSTTFVFEKNEDRCTVDVDYVPHGHGDVPDVTILVRVNYQR